MMLRRACAAVHPHHGAPRPTPTPWCRRPRYIMRSAGDPDAPPTAVPPDSDLLMEQLTAVKRQLDEAVAREDYGEAQKLKQQSDVLREQLPPLQQYALHQAERLGRDSSSLQERRAAITALGEVGDATCLPQLASALCDAELNEPAAEAMWAVFNRCPDPAVAELMARGTAMLSQGSPLLRHRAALEVFEEACKLAPAFAEAHNKRATVLYLMHRYEESIEACQLVLQLNPHHFGAASGMGMCHLGREDHVAALAAFETALAINPGLDPIQTYAAALRAKLADDATGPR